MEAARKKFATGEGVHRPLVVSVNVGLTAVVASRNRAFQRVEGFLCLLAANALQPCQGCLLVRSSFGKGKPVSDDDEGSIRAGVADPAVVFICFFISLNKFALSPISHGA